MADKPAPIKQIGIRFSDNDFYFTVMPFMRLLLPDDHTHPALQTPAWTKFQVVLLFNELAYGLYLIKQNGWRYEAGSAHLKRYLTIKEENVYFDKEVAEWIEKNDGWCNGEFFCVDFLLRYVWVV